MRQEQFEKLQILAEKLTDVFIEEADPDTWPGSGLASANMDQKTRGDRYWSKKNAAATLTVIMKTTNLLGVIRQRSAADTPGGVGDPEQEKEDASLDAEIAAAEKEATRLMDQIQRRARKEAFDKKTHGKAKG